jgi:uncharacterized coiled-coil protein SlyX
MAATARTWMFVTLAVALSVVVAVHLQAQGQKPASLDDLLGEVRGLRAEINRAAAASMRMQSLLARLSLQEARIASLSRQLSDARQQLTATQLGLAPLTEQLKQFGNVSALGPAFKTMYEQGQRTERELLDRTAALEGQIAEEQGRWLEFNAGLDELERALAVR